MGSMRIRAVAVASTLGVLWACSDGPNPAPGYATTGPSAGGDDQPCACIPALGGGESCDACNPGLICNTSAGGICEQPQSVPVGGVCLQSEQVTALTGATGAAADLCAAGLVCRVINAMTVATCVDPSEVGVFCFGIFCASGYVCEGEKTAAHCVPADASMLAPDGGGDGGPPEVGPAGDRAVEGGPRDAAPPLGDGGNDAESD